MESKHTPGPWEARRDPSHFDTLSSVVGGWDKPGHLNRELMVEVGGFVGGKTQEANTHLIAAAPELLEALEELYATVVGCLIGAEIAEEQARKAIKKAKGEDRG